MITKKNIFYTVAVAAAGMFVLVCKHCEENSLPVFPFLKELWRAKPYTMLIVIVNALIVSAGIVFVLQTLRFALVNFDEIIRIIRLPGDTTPSGGAPIYYMSDIEQEEEREGNPFLVVREFTEEDSKFSSSQIFGKFEGKTVAATKGNEGIVGVYGPDAFRKFTGVFLPAIFRAFDMKHNTLIIDTQDGTMFPDIYPSIKGAEGDSVILDMDNLSNSDGINILQSARTDFYRKILAELIVDRFDFDIPIQKIYVKRILSYSFEAALKEHNDATLADAEIEVLNITPSKFCDFFNLDKEEFNNKKNSGNWDKALEVAKDAIAPYAAEPGLNRGTTIAGFLEGIYESRTGKKHFYMKPAKTRPAMIPIEKYILFDYLRTAENILYERNGGKVQEGYKCPISAFIAYWDPFIMLPSLDAFLGLGRLHSIFYMINFKSSKRPDIPPWIRYDDAYLDYTHHYLLTGTPDDETAIYLSEKAGLMRVGDALRLRVSPEDLKNVQREKVFLITNSWTRGGRVYDLEKCYFKESVRSGYRIVSDGEGEALKLKIDDYDHEKASSYKVIEQKSFGGDVNDL